MEEKNVSKSKQTYDSLSFFYCVKGFENLKTLDEPHTRVALRILKEHFDRYIGFETSDSLFEDIFNRFPFLYPYSPLGCGYEMMGFIVPIKNILKEHGVNESYCLTILRFFGAPRRRIWNG